MKRDKVQLDEYTLFCGHFYRYLTSYLGKPLSTFTFLRNPFDRAFSHYEHIRRDHNHFFYDKVQAQGSFLAFINHPETQPLIKNFQTRALSGIFDPVAVANSIVNSDNKKYPLEKFLTTFDTGLDDHTSLLVAKDYLMRCIFVGITERPQESVKKLAKILAVPSAHRLRWDILMRSLRRSVDSLSKEEWATLAGLLSTDMELYEFGQNLLFS